MKLREIEIISNPKFDEDQFICMEGIKGGRHLGECFVSMGGKLGEVQEVQNSSRGAE